MAWNARSFAQNARSHGRRAAIGCPDADPGCRGGAAGRSQGIGQCLAWLTMIILAGTSGLAGTLRAADPPVRGRVHRTDSAEIFVEAPPTCQDCEPVGPAYEPAMGTLFQAGSPLWFRGEYLHWATKGHDVPALVTSSPQGTARGQAGVLGETSTNVLFGNDTLNDSGRPGGRFTLGWDFAGDRDRGFEVTYFFLGAETTRFDATSTGDPILARPFLDIENGEDAANLIAFSGLVEGQISIDAESNFQGFDVLWRRPLTVSDFRRFDILFGYRWTNLEDDLQINDRLISRSADSGLAVGTTIDSQDLFRSENDFHGANLGMSLTHGSGPLHLQWLAKLAIGSTTGRVQIAGRSTTTVPGEAAVESANGFLAQPTNSGTLEDSRFAVVPELGATLHWDLNCHSRISVGYSFLYWSQVVRASEQIDTSLNLTQLPPGTLTGAAKPSPMLQFSDYWAQGLNLMYQFQY